jgi:hypothetical protein
MSQPKIKNCPECQFEKGHSRECSKFIEQKNPMKKDTDQLKQKACELILDHEVAWGGDGYFCQKCGIEFSPKVELEKTVREEEKERQWELMMECLPSNAENLSTLTPYQAYKLINCFLGKNPWN